MACGCALAAYLGLWQLLGSSPRTVAFELERWENNTWGLHNIERERIWGTVAVSADGSRANNVTSAHYKHYFVPAGRWMVHDIYRKPENVAFRIDDQARTASILHCGCTWEEAAPPPYDPECSGAAAARFGATRKVNSGTVAGIAVIRYRGTGTENEHEMAFAPEFGCDLLEERNSTYNVIGLPTSRFHYIVRSYLPGEPNQKVLHPPAQYALRDKPFLP
jgi:hypothetical protein